MNFFFLPVLSSRWSPIKRIPWFGRKAELDFSLRHLTNPPVYTGAQKCEIWPQFSTPLAFELPSFRNRARYMKSKINLGATIITYVLPKFGTVRSTYSRDPYGGLGLINIGRGKFAQSSITQPRIARLRWNLTSWWIMGRRRLRIIVRVSQRSSHTVSVTWLFFANIDGIVLGYKLFFASVSRRLVCGFAASFTVVLPVPRLCCFRDWLGLLFRLYHFRLMYENSIKQIWNACSET